MSDGAELAAEVLDVEQAEAAIRAAFGDEHVEVIEEPPTLSRPAPAFLAELEGENRVEWMIDQLLTEQTVAFLAGEPKTLKSWTAAAMAISVASGVPILGFEPTGTGVALLVQEESRSVDFARRIRWLARGLGLEPSDLRDLHIASQAGVLLDDLQGQATLAREIERLSPRLVILDPLVRMHSADENRAREMRPVLGYLRRLQAVHGCGVALVHHMGKARFDGPKVRPGQRLRGTSDLHALLDSALYFDARPGVRHVAVEVEHREAPPPEPFMITLDVDEEDGSARLTAEAGTLADVATLAAMPGVEAVLEAHPDGLVQREIEDKAEGRAQTVRDALRRLEASGRAISEPGMREDALGRRRWVKVWKRRSE
jgi:hypothetical protein